MQRPLRYPEGPFPFALAKIPKIYMIGARFEVALVTAMFRVGGRHVFFSDNSNVNLVRRIVQRAASFVVKGINHG